MFLKNKKRIALLFFLILIFVLITIGVSSCFICQTKLEGYQSISALDFNLSPNDRVLILAPHPDDEVLGPGGIIQKAKEMNLPVRICFLTYGDANQMSFYHYYKRPVVDPEKAKEQALIRHNEALKADQILGVKPEDIVFLGYPDLGIVKIWYNHWDEKKPFKSMLTRAEAVPYDNAFNPGSLYKGENILEDIKKVIADFKPTKIFISHPADQHPDHRGYYLFTQVAVWDLINSINVSVIPYVIHHDGEGWPSPHGYYPSEILPYPDGLAPLIAWKSYKLDSKEEDNKFEAAKAHKTQYDYDTKYLESFIRKNELFGNFDEINLINKREVEIIPDNAGGLVKFLPEFISNIKKRLFIGKEYWSVKQEDKNIIIKVKFDRPFSLNVNFTFALFGYRSDVPFKDMPKLDVLVKNDYEIYDQRDLIGGEGIDLYRNFNYMEIKIPLKKLGDPQKILFSGESREGRSQFNWLSWRIINLTNN